MSIINMIILFFLYRISIAQQLCFISGTLVTPKMYPSDNVNVQFTLNQPKYVQVDTMQESDLTYVTSTDGAFSFSFRTTSTEVTGVLNLNLANQYIKQIAIDLSAKNAFTQKIGQILLDSGHTQLTQVSGCVIAKDTQEPMIDATVQITYDQPTLLDKQSTVTNSSGCFDFTDTLMKLMIYKAQIVITASGYSEFNCNSDDSLCKGGINLYNTYNYEFSQPIVLEPDYQDTIIDFTGWKQGQLDRQAIIAISCQEPNKIVYQSTFEGEAFDIVKNVFKKGQFYTCAVIASDQNYVGYYTFTLPSSQSSINAKIIMNPFGQNQTVNSTVSASSNKSNTTVPSNLTNSTKPNITVSSNSTNSTRPITSNQTNSTKLNVTNSTESNKTNVTNSTSTPNTSNTSNTTQPTKSNATNSTNTTKPNITNTTKPNNTNTSISSNTTINSTNTTKPNISNSTTANKSNTSSPLTNSSKSSNSSVPIKSSPSPVKSSPSPSPVKSSPSPVKSFPSPSPVKSSPSTPPLSLSDIYSDYIGRVDQMSDPDCASTYQIWLADVEISFYYQLTLSGYSEHNVFINQTKTAPDGSFSLIVKHPKLVGYYTGILQLVKAGFVESQVMIDIDVEYNDFTQTVNVGTLQLMAFQGPPKC